MTFLAFKTYLRPFLTWRSAAILSLVLFVYNASRVEWVDFANEWNGRACALKQTGYLPNADCRHHFVKALFAAQSLAAESSATPDQVRWPKCVLQSDPGYPVATQNFQNILNGQCARSQGAFHPYDTRVPDLGWDAYAIWFGRASFLYFGSEHKKDLGECSNRFVCLASMLHDLSWVKKFPNREHYHYPILVPFIYASVMAAYGEVNPVMLQVLQVIVFLAVGLLYYRTRQGLSVWHVLCFAFVPIAGTFLFRLYAELWMILFLLTSLYFFDRQKFLWGAIVLALVPWVKAEGFFVAAMFTLALLRDFFLRTEKLALYQELLKKPKRDFAYALMPLLSSLIFLHWQETLKDHQFWIPLVERLRDLPHSMRIIFSILGYFLDVLFRPGMWAVLWPMVMFIGFKKTTSGKRSFLGIVAIYLVSIVLSFWQFSFGHKEVVLTGSGRALWVALPILWVLIRSRSKTTGSGPRDVLGVTSNVS